MGEAVNAIDPVVDFSNFAPEIANDVLEENYIELGDIRGEKVQKFIDDSIKEFNRLKINSIFTCKAPSLETLVAFLRSKIPLKMCQSMALNWPPVVPNTVLTVKPVFYLFVKMCKEVQNPELFVYWATRAVFPRPWVKKGWLYNPLAAGISFGKVKKLTNEDCWIILDVQYRVTVYAIREGKAVDIFHKYCKKFEEDGKSVICYGFKDNEVLRFEPEQKEQTKWWTTVLDAEKRQPLPYFFSKGGVDYPEIYLTALYHAITSHDLICLRCLTQSTVLQTKQQEVIEALFNIFCHAGKYNILLETLASSEFEDPNLKNELVLRGNSALTFLFKIIVKRYTKKYFEKVISKIIRYIDSKGDLKINKPEECDKELLEKTIFSVFKYIVSSIDYVPKEIRHIASVIRTFIIVRYNDRGALKNALSGFFFLRFFTPAITIPKLYDKDFQVQNPGSVKEFAKVFQNICNFQLMETRGQDFAYMDKRIKDHLFPELEKFLYSVADLKGTLKYEIPPYETVEESLKTVADSVAENYDEFINKFRIATGETNDMSSTIGWIFASAITSMFPQAIDKEAIEREEQERRANKDQSGEAAAAGNELEEVDAMDLPDADIPVMDLQDPESNINTGIMQPEETNAVPLEPEPALAPEPIQEPELAPAPVDLPPVNPEPPQDLPPLNPDEAPPTGKKKGKKGKKAKAAATMEAPAPVSDLVTTGKKTGKKGKKKGGVTLDPSTPSAEPLVTTEAPTTGKKKKGKSIKPKKSSKGPSLTIEPMEPVSAALITGKKTGGKKKKGGLTMEGIGPSSTVPKKGGFTLEGIGPSTTVPKKGKKKGGGGLTLEGVGPSTTVPKTAAKKARKGSLGEINLNLGAATGKKRGASVEPRKRGPSLTVDSAEVDVNELFNESGKKKGKKGGKKGKKGAVTQDSGDVPIQEPIVTPKKGKKGKKGEPVTQEQPTPVTPATKKKGGKKKAKK